MISPISRRPNFTIFEHNTSIGEAVKLSEQNFENFYRKGSFFQKSKRFAKIFIVLPQRGQSEVCLLSTIALFHSMIKAWKPV